MPISALKAYQIERIYADMREPDTKRTYCVTATELDKIRKEKGMTYKTLAEKAGLCIDTVQIACKGCRVSLKSADKMAKVLQCAVDKAFKLEVRESSYSSTTINGVHRFLRAVCHYAEKHKLLTDNPIDAVRAPKIDAEIVILHPFSVLSISLLGVHQIPRRIPFQNLESYYLPALGGRRSH